MQYLLTELAVATLGQMDAEAAADAVKVQSIWDFVVKGGPMMIPIGLCSFIALTIIVERMISLRHRQIMPVDLFSDVSRLLSGGNNGNTLALEHCNKDGSPLAKIFIAAIKKLEAPAEVLERHIQDAGERAVVGLRKNLRALSVIASIAPLMGLLGTIFGMINAFQTVATSGEALGRTELLAKGIYQAMITTAAGLLVAIPVLVAYHWLSAKVERLVDEMDCLTVEFIEKHGAAATLEKAVARPKLRPAENDDEASDVEESEEVVQAATA